MANLGRWSASAPWTDEISGDRRLVSSDTGDGWDAARILLPEVTAHLTAELAPHGRILIGLPERHLLTAASLRPDDPDFASLFAEFTVEQSGRRRRAHRPARLRAGGRPARRVRRGRRRLMAAPGGAMPAFEALRVEVADAVALVTLDRPEALNALTVGLKGELLAAFRAIARDRSIRAVVLTGAGRAFCAGQDLKERQAPDAAPLAVELRERYNPIIRAMRALDQPIVGAINGVAAGAGASLAFACDIRIAATEASFLLAFGRIGLVPDSGATWLLPRLVGGAKAAQLALTTDPLSAADAERFGLVARGRPRRRGGRGGAGRRRPAGRPRPGRPRLDEARARPRLGRSTSSARSRRRPTARASPGASADHAEGMAAFLEKRPPRFTGE